MDDFVLARVLHVLAIIPWIGGVSFVTTALMPSIRRNNPSDARLSAFHRVEQSFAWQARLWVVLAGVSGFWMIHRADLWDRFADRHYRWEEYTSELQALTRISYAVFCVIKKRRVHI